MKENQYEKAKAEIAKIGKEKIDRESRKRDVESKKAQIAAENLKKGAERLQKGKSMVVMVLQEANEVLCENRAVILPWAQYSEQHEDYSRNSEDPTEYSVSGIKLKMRIQDLNGGVHVSIQGERLSIAGLLDFEDTTFNHISLHGICIDLSMFDENAEKTEAQIRKMVTASIVKLHNDDHQTFPL